MGTFTPQMALDIVRKYARDAPVTSIDYQLCDIVQSIIWNAYPWSWAQAALTPIALSDGVQDYPPGTEIHIIIRARITRTDTTPDQYNELAIRDYLPPDLTKASMWGIQSVAYEPVGAKIRLERAMSIGAGETYTLNVDHWAGPTQITSEGLETGLTQPDRYFNVFVEGLKWKLYEYIGDSRAGTIQTDRSGRRAYTGQMGIFMESLADMMRTQDYAGEGSEFPDTPIGNREPAGWSIYG